MVHGRGNPRETVNPTERMAMNSTIKELELRYMKKAVPAFRAGDTVRVAVRIVEGDKEADPEL